MATDTIPRPTSSGLSRPWPQLIVGIICMVMVANLQYGWTLFVGPIGDKYHWTKAAIQVTFTLFVLFETWLVPAEGWLVDKFGPRWMIVGGGILCGIAWTINSFADSLAMFYFAGIVGGITGRSLAGPSGHSGRTLRIGGFKFAQPFAQPLRVRLSDGEHSHAALVASGSAGDPGAALAHGLGHRRVHDLD